MYLEVILILSVISFTSCNWFEGFTYNKDMDLGYGVTLNFDKSEKENVSLLETHSPRLNYNGIGFSVNKILDKNALQFDIFYNEKNEGRGKKVGEIVFPAIIGMKVTGLAAMTLFGVSVFVLKALAISKLALMTTAVLLITKLFYKTKGNHVELEHLPEYHPNYNIAQGQVDDTNYLNYFNYDGNKDVLGSSSGQYTSIIEPSNGTAAHSTNLQITRRRDALHRIPQTYIMFRKYFVD